MDSSVPSFFVLHYFLEFSQIQVYWVGEAVQPSHPLLSPSRPALNLPHHQGPLKWVDSSHQVAKVFEFNFILVLLVNIQSWFPLGLTCLISLHSKELSRVLSNNTVESINSWCSDFFTVQISHQYMATGKIRALIYGCLLAKWYLFLLTQCLDLL